MPMPEGTNYGGESLQVAFLDYAADEGSQTALDELERIKSSLETIVECGDKFEVTMAAQLISSVDKAISQVLANRVSV